MLFCFARSRAVIPLKVGLLGEPPTPALPTLVEAPRCPDADGEASEPEMLVLWFAAPEVGGL